MYAGTTTLIRWRALWRRLVPLAVAAAVLLLSPSQAGAAEVTGEGSAPAVGGTSVTSFTEREAMLEVEINPQGIETEFEIRLVSQAHSSEGEREPVAGGPQAQTGHIAAVSEDETVGAIMKGLQPGYAYWYVVTATNSAGKTEGDSPYTFVFKSGSGGGGNTGNTGSQYGSETPSWYTSLSESESEQTIKEYEAKQAQIAKEQEAQRAREAAVRAFEEAALKKREEEELAKEHPAHIAAACVVPRLKGDTLKAARRAILKAHCQLGEIHHPQRSSGTLIVNAQTPKRGKRLTAGAKIAVALAKRSSSTPRT